MVKTKNRITKICRDILQLTLPNNEERERTLGFAENLRLKLQSALIKANVESEVQIEGSIAKDTWLAGEKDIDLFIVLPRKYDRERLKYALEIAKKLAGDDFSEVYAEHPYIEAKFDEFIVDLVPCFSAKTAEEVTSSVDRTPLHTSYIIEKFDDKKKDEARLLKRFMKGIGAYGAEIKVGGFSGYLCELLILHYGSFPATLQSVANWRRYVIIDAERHYKGNETEAIEKFLNEPFVVIDPVDMNRNVASAVRIDKLNLFIAASREFLRIPDSVFFYPRKQQPLQKDRLLKEMKRRGSSVIFLRTRIQKTALDILWGQIYKSQRVLRTLLVRHDFDIIRYAAWSDEKSICVFVFELCNHRLPASEKHLGPHIEKREDADRFLQKYRASSQIISGPRIENDRWTVDRRRKYLDPGELFRDKLKDGGKKIGVASLISQAFSSSLDISVNDEIEDFYSSDCGFDIFLTDFLNGKPQWLR